MAYRRISHVTAIRIPWIEPEKESTVWVSGRTTDELSDTKIKLQVGVAGDRCWDATFPEQLPVLCKWFWVHPYLVFPCKGFRMFGISDMPTHCGTSRHELKIGSVKKARNTTSFAEEMLPFKVLYSAASHTHVVLSQKTFHGYRLLILGWPPILKSS